MNMQVFEHLESEVRSYCRAFPTIFTRAVGSSLFDRQGREYLDFFSGAGALNYGHNHPRLKQRLLDYIAGDGITHGLDMATEAKEEFLERFERIILRPRGMEYKVQFPGPTGTNAVEAALKLARKVTGRQSIVSFTNAFHGMTLGSLSVTGNGFKRRGAGLPLVHTSCMPFDGYFGEDADTLEYLEALVVDEGSGVDLPAAVIVESIQAEGGVNVARFSWLQRLAEICRNHDIMLIVDDIQVGCGRTGPFFSFEPAGIEPDLICLSKSLSGYGLPLAVTLIRPDLDIWEPGEHNGTFRGNNPAFVTASEALTFWENDDLARAVQAKGAVVRTALEAMSQGLVCEEPEVRGRGLLQGIDCRRPGIAEAICRRAFKQGMIVETSGPESTVVKLMPPLTIAEDALARGLDILARCAAEVFADVEPDDVPAPPRPAYAAEATA